MHPAIQPPGLKVQIGAAGHGTTWLPVATFAAASFACRMSIEAHDLGASLWRGVAGSSMPPRCSDGQLQRAGRPADGSEA